MQFHCVSVTGTRFSGHYLLNWNPRWSQPSSKGQNVTVATSRYFISSLRQRPNHSPRLPFSALPYPFIQQYTLSSLDTNFANSILIDISWLHSSRSRSTLSSLSRSNPFSTTARSSDPDLRIARLFTLSSSPAKPGTYPRQLIVA